MRQPIIGLTAFRRDLGTFLGDRERRFPTLGVCRGTQAIAVVSGGLMVQDLAPEHGYPLIEHTPQSLRESRHEVTLDDDSQIGEVVGIRSFPVNSIDHQALFQPATNDAYWLLSWHFQPDRRTARASGHLVAT